MRCVVSDIDEEYHHDFLNTQTRVFNALSKRLAPAHNFRDHSPVSEYVYGPPTDGKPFKLAMGLRTLEPELWLEGGADLATQLAERDLLIQGTKSLIYGEVPGFESEIREFISGIAANLAQFHEKIYEVHAESVIHRETGLRADLLSSQPLLEIARVIAEDLCVLKRIDGSWTLVAGAVLFPSRWKLSEKLGKTLDQIHVPVPGYQSALAPYMSETFDKIKADRPVWRKNWSLHSTPDLHQPTTIHLPSIPEDYWWRTERQTLTRSATSESILFTIRNRAEPLSWIMKRPEEARAFSLTLQSMSPETVAYKGLTADHKALVNTLMMCQ